MPLPEDPDVLRRQLYAGGGHGGAKPVRPKLPGEWRIGMPCHWQEQTAFTQRKHFVVRVLMLLNLAAAVAYMQYRIRFTVGVFTKHPALIAYQILFVCLEVISSIDLVFRVVETWNVTTRNSVDLQRIPNEKLSTNFAYGRRSNVRPEYSNYPSVGVFIPCYNEEVDLVLETIIGAINIDYPTELLTIYLCDDGKDDMKRSMISQIRKKHKNVHYVIRPDNSHAKAGNLNYSLERTRSDLVVTLDADFVARPNLLQRLVPYYYVYNPDSATYEFNETLAVVQTPQHFRNLSPYDNDPLDQRSTLFFEIVLPGKDWFNASTMIGTTNLLNRKPLTEAGYYPFHSITEDTAMSLKFHSLGYRTYFVNESLATGLATTSLWSNLRQRARWLKGDWQILFSKLGPLSAPRLSIIQRLLYMHMTFSRVISIVHLVYDIGIVMLLVFAISPLDAVYPVQFISFLGSYLGLGIIVRAVLCMGGSGLDKSESGSAAFEAIFRYTCIKGLFIALFKGKNIAFKVTDKTGVPGRAKEPASDNESFDNARMIVLGEEAPRAQESPPGRSEGAGAASSTPTSDNSDKHSSSSTNNDKASSETKSEEEGRRGFKKRFGRRRVKTLAEKAQRTVDVKKNLKRVWFNALMASVLTAALIYGIIIPPVPNTDDVVEIDGQKFRVQFQSVLPVAMALGFGVMNLLPHLVAVYLCFIPYVSGWLMTDLVHGRCDQYAIHPQSGKLFVPWSFISLLTVAKTLIMIGSITALAVFIFGPSDGLTLVPVK